MRRAHVEVGLMTYIELRAQNPIGKRLGDTPLPPIFLGEGLVAFLMRLSFFLEG